MIWIIFKNVVAIRNWRYEFVAMNVNFLVGIVPLVPCKLQTYQHLEQ